MAWFFEPIVKIIHLKLNTMKVLTYVRSGWLALALLFVNMALYAQEKKVDVDIDLDKGNNAQWYTNPVVWIIGGAVFILLLVALMRGGKEKA
jgi:hypothetical protein